MLAGIYGEWASLWMEILGERLPWDRADGYEGEGSEDASSGEGLPGVKTGGDAFMRNGSTVCGIY